jgi:hypothetical protein
MRTTCAIAAAAFGALAAATPAPAQDAYDWLAGCWVNGAGTTREVWSRDAGGLLFGYSVSVGPDGRAGAFEQLRIETGEDGDAYVAYPGGGPPTSFRAALVGPGRALFANPDHDFPQVIDYARNGDELVAAISSIEGEGRLEFRMSRCPRGG